jgi:hypothetical protein
LKFPRKHENISSLDSILIDFSWNQIYETSCLEIHGEQNTLAILSSLQIWNKNTCSCLTNPPRSTPFFISFFLNQILFRDQFPSEWHTKIIITFFNRTRILHKIFSRWGFETSRIYYPFSKDERNGYWVGIWGEFFLFHVCKILKSDYGITKITWIEEKSHANTKHWLIDFILLICLFNI